MKTIKIIICAILSSTILSCTTSKTTKVASKEESNKYLENTMTTSESLAQKELDFWQKKLNNQPTQYPYLSKIAKANSLLFSEKGNISYLIEAEEKLLKINQKTKVHGGNSMGFRK